MTTAVVDKSTKKLMNCFDQEKEDWRSEKIIIVKEKEL